VVGQVDLQQVQAAINGLVQAELPHQEVDGTNTSVADATAAVADLVVDVAGGEHGFGAAAQVVLVQAFLNAALATGEFLSYCGIHSKSLQCPGRRALGHTHQTPEMLRDFEFFS
jgi:hypothetical protein